VTLFEPSRAWQDSLHQRVLQEDVTAFAELCELALPHLVQYLEKRYPQTDSTLHETVAIDSLLDYQSRASQYDFNKISLYAYLRMSARRDMLNAIEKASRIESRLTDIDNPFIQNQMMTETSSGEYDGIDEWLLDNTDLSLSEIIKTLDDELDEHEKKALMLMLDGVRETEVYAEVLGLDKLDRPTQQIEVKRTKDRLMKKLRRFGEKIRKS
jgi:DNA-directed RNA polymerase specialized sigma24 family protein